MQSEILYKETDVLVIGGGLAGCMAAISARSSGVDVTVLEKGNTLRSGACATGIDHCWAYIPEIHEKEISLDDLLDDHERYAEGLMDRSLVRVVAENSYLRVLDLERFGLEMRDGNNQFRLQKKIHRCPTFIHFFDKNMKVKLARAAKNSGANIENRMMSTDLLVENGRVVGALAFSIREGNWHVYKCKAVVLATGGAERIFGNPGGLPFNLSMPPTWSGDGHAMAFKAGARLLNMEMNVHHSGPKNFHRAGRGSYVPGLVSDAYGKPLREYASKMKGLPAESDAIFRKVFKEGNGPVYIDCRKNTPEQNEYIRQALYSEGCTSYLEHLDGIGVDLSTDRIELTVYGSPTSAWNGIEINTLTETSLPGLFASGSVMGGMPRCNMPGAIVMGWRAGESAAQLAREIPSIKLGDQAQDIINGQVKLASEFCSRNKGSSWQDAQRAMQNIMDSYAGEMKSASMLEVGYNNLTQLKEQARKEVKVTGYHELYRAMEVMSLMEVAEMVIISAYNRKESRGSDFFRADYPQQNDDEWKKFITLKKEEGKTIVGVRPVNLTE